MRAYIKDEGKEYRYEDVQKISIVNGDFVIRYLDVNGEDHCELGKVPDELLVTGM